MDGPLLVHELLRNTGARLVLAESCTAGLIAAHLARRPGMSEVLCGSAVVYQEQTKVTWLNVSEELLNTAGAVSREVAEAMATGVLEITPQASVSLSITGHLGPGAPAQMDGTAWVAVAVPGTVWSRHLRLTADAATGPDVEVTIRVLRQENAARQALEFLVERLEQMNL